MAGLEDEIGFSAVLLEQAEQARPYSGVPADGSHRKEGQRYKELGESYFKQQNEKKLPKLIRQIEKLGVKVIPA